MPSKAYARPVLTTAIQSTLFRFAQYFGWSEILPQYARDREPRHAQQMDRIEELRQEVARAFGTDDDGPGGFMIWREGSARSGS